ncbi:hypothetical protein Tco_1239824 [Tanacetum coccineum]
MKRVFRYLKGTSDLGILYVRKEEERLIGFSDSDYAGNFDDRKSTSGYVFKFSSGAVSWSSKKQPVVSLSTTEAEFIAAAACACQNLVKDNVIGMEYCGTEHQLGRWNDKTTKARAVYKNERFTWASF